MICQAKQLSSVRLIITICSLAGACFLLSATQGLDESDTTKASAPSIPPESKTQSQSLDHFLLEKLKTGHVPGLAAGIVKRDQLVWSRGFGWADLENKIPMTDQTLMNIGSISKTITAAAVMQLWERGKFQLDDDVNRYLPFPVRNPRFPDVPITFRQLLTHRSSIKDGSAYDESYACGDPAVSLKDWLSGYLVPGGKYYNEKENFHAWRPGSLDVPKEPRSYTNVGFGLLGYLAEVLSGEDFAQYCKKHIFSPLGMEHTQWYLAGMNVANHAIPYTYIADGTNFEPLLSRYPVEAKPFKTGEYFAHCLYSFPNYPDGLVRTSVRDLSRFLSAFIQNGGSGNKRILKSETVQMMLSSDHFGRALCWNKLTLRGTDLAWGHDGGDPGISTRMLFRAKDGVGVILFFNRDGPVKTTAAEILERLLDEAIRF